LTLLDLRIYHPFADSQTKTAVILRCSPFFTASLEGWATSARGHPSRRRASARLLVIASEAKQSMVQQASKRKNGLLRRFAPRNDGAVQPIFIKL
jgi:hypothetical protein